MLGNAVPAPLEEEDVTAPVHSNVPGGNDYNSVMRDAFWNLGLDESWKQGEDDRLDWERTNERTP